MSDQDLTDDETASLRASTERLAAELKKLSEALRWKNARASDEVKDAVHAIAQELERTAARLEESAPSLAALRDEATLQGHFAVLEAKDKLAVLEDAVRSALKGAGTSATFLGEAARMKLALARMDAADLFADKRRLLHEEHRRLARATDTTLHDLEKRLLDLKGGD